MIPRIFIVSIVAILLMPASAYAGDSGWVGTSRLVSISRGARAKSEIPVSLDCRNASANPRALKLEIRVVTAPNADKRDWVFFTADLNYQPGESPADWKNWKKVSGKALKTPSGKTVYCSLFHNNSAGTAGRTAPPISVRTSVGFRTLH